MKLLLSVVFGAMILFAGNDTKNKEDSIEVKTSCIKGRMFLIYFVNGKIIGMEQMLENYYAKTDRVGRYSVSVYVAKCE